MIELIGHPSLLSPWLLAFRGWTTIGLTDGAPLYAVPLKAAGHGA